MRILADKLCSYLKVQTFSKQQVLGNAVNDLLATSQLRQAESAVSLPLTAQNRRRESQTSRSGDIFQLNDRLSFPLWKKKKITGPPS